MQFKQLKEVENSEQRIMWMSEEIQDHIDWPFCYIVKLEYLREYYSNPELPKYCGEIELVAPAACEKEWASAYNCMGFTEEEWNKTTFQQKCIILSDYGVKALVFSVEGENKKKVMDALKKEFPLIDMLTGFYMDRPENMIGADGWDCIRGNGHCPGDDEDDS